jgi:hypothetical protein
VGREDEKLLAGVLPPPNLPTEMFTMTLRLDDEDIEAEWRPVEAQHSLALRGEGKQPP